MKISEKAKAYNTKSDEVKLMRRQQLEDEAKDFPETFINKMVEIEKRRVKINKSMHEEVANMKVINEEKMHTIKKRKKQIDDEEVIKKMRSMENTLRKTSEKEGLIKQSFDNEAKLKNALNTQR